MTKQRRATVVVLAAFAVAFAAIPAAMADYQTGLDYFKAGKYVEAAAEFQALVDESPEYDYGYYILGLSFVKMKKHAEGETNFRKAISLNGDKFEYHHGLANSLMERNQYSKAIAALNSAEGLANNSKTKYALYSMRGFAHVGLEHWSDAINDLQKAQAIKNTATIAKQMGKAYYSLGHSDKAVPQFRTALKSNTNDSTSQLLLTESLIKLGKEARSDSEKSARYGEAMDEAEKYRRMNPNSFEAENLVGKAALGAGSFSVAEGAFANALRIKPDYCYAMINLGKTRIAQEDWTGAQRPLLDAADCAPRMPVIYESLGLVYQKQGSLARDTKAKQMNYDKALDYYDQALKLNPSSSFVKTAIATIQENKNRMEHNQAMDQLDAEQRAAEEAEAKRIEEEKKKREEWKKKRQGG